MLIHLHCVEAAAGLLRAFGCFTGEVAAAAAAGAAAAAHDAAAAAAGASALRQQWRRTMSSVVESALLGAAAASVTGHGASSASASQLPQQPALWGGRTAPSAGPAMQRNGSRGQRPSPGGGGAGADPLAFGESGSPIRLKLPASRFRGATAGGPGAPDADPDRDRSRHASLELRPHSPQAGAGLMPLQALLGSPADAGGRHWHGHGSGRYSTSALPEGAAAARPAPNGGLPRAPPNANGSLHHHHHHHHPLASGPPTNGNASVFGAGEAHDRSAGDGAADDDGDGEVASAQELLALCLQLLQLGCQCMAFTSFSAHVAARAAAAAAAAVASTGEAPQLPMSPSSPRSPSSVLSRQAMRRLSSTARMRSRKGRPSLYGTTSGGTTSTSLGGAPGQPLPGVLPSVAVGAAAAALAGGRPPALSIGSAAGAAAASSRAADVPATIIGFPIPVVWQPVPPSRPAGGGGLAAGQPLAASFASISKSAAHAPAPPASAMSGRPSPSGSSGAGTSGGGGPTPMRLELHHCAFDVSRLWRAAVQQPVAVGSNNVGHTAASVFLKPGYAAGLLLMAYACTAVQQQEGAPALPPAAGVGPLQQQQQQLASLFSHEPADAHLQLTATRSARRVNWQLLHAAAAATHAAALWHELADWHRAALLAFATANALQGLGGGGEDLPPDSPTKQRRSVLAGMPTPTPPPAPPASELAALAPAHGAPARGPAAAAVAVDPALAEARVACLRMGQRVLISQARRRHRAKGGIWGGEEGRCCALRPVCVRRVGRKQGESGSGGNRHQLPYTTGPVSGCSPYGHRRLPARQPLQQQPTPWRAPRSHLPFTVMPPPCPATRDGTRMLPAPAAPRTAQVAACQRMEVQDACGSLLELVALPRRLLGPGCVVHISLLQRVSAPTGSCACVRVALHVFWRWCLCPPPLAPSPALLPLRMWPAGCGQCVWTGTAPYNACHTRCT